MASNNNPKSSFEQTFDDVVKGVKEGVQQASKSMNDSAKKNGYTSFPSMIVGEIQKGFANTTAVIETRHDRFIQSIIKARKKIESQSKNPSYREGYNDVLAKYSALADSHYDDLTFLDEQVEEEYNEFYKHRTSRKYDKGYFEGLVFIKNELLVTKQEQMRKLHNQLKTGSKE